MLFHILRCTGQTHKNKGCPAHNVNNSAEVETPSIEDRIQLSMPHKLRCANWHFMWQEVPEQPQCFPLLLGSHLRRVGRDRAFRDHVFLPSKSSIEESKWRYVSSSMNAPHSLSIFLVVLAGYYVSKETLERRNHPIDVPERWQVYAERGRTPLLTCPWKGTEWGWGDGVVALLCLWIITLTGHQRSQPLYPPRQFLWVFP